MPSSNLMVPGLPPGPCGVLYHFSEDPGIVEFLPRRSRPLPGFPRGREVVWAIDEYHAPLYYFPRDCPRVVLWKLERSTYEDVDRWMDGCGGRMVAYVEREWMHAIERCRIYRYAFQPDGFEDTGDHGTHVSPRAVRALEIERISDLPRRLAEADVLLKPLDSLQSLAGAMTSSLHFSGIRLRNARSWGARETAR